MSNISLTIEKRDTSLVLRQRGEGRASVAVPGGALLLSDGSSFLLLADGSSKLLVDLGSISSVLVGNELRNTSLVLRKRND
jgi:hypothetical protein